MGSCCSSDPPAPPNPVQVAGAQTSANVGTAIANAFLNNVNQTTPLGSLTYTTDPANDYTFTDPSNGQTFRIPRFTAQQELSPAQLALQQSNQAAQQNLSNLAVSQSSRLQNVLGGPIDLSQAPAPGDIGALSQTPLAQTTFGATPSLLTSLPNTGQQQTTFGDAGAITRSYGPQDNFSADRTRIEQALFARQQPQLDRERAAVEQRLADQGIRYGSPAYSAAMDDYNRQLNDLRLGITAQAGTEQQRLSEMAQAQAQFQNTAQQQLYNELQGRGTFANQAQQQQFEQALSAAGFSNQAIQNIFSQAALRGQFSNAALAQQQQQRQAIFGAQNDARNQYLSEQYAARNQPINEITALLSGSQVQQPAFTRTPSTTIPTTDIAGLLNQNFNQQFANYQQQSTNTNALIGGLLGFAGNIARGPALSDVREKEDIVPMGSVFAAGDDNRRHELPIYEYSYKRDPASTRHVGPMAQDVEKIDRGAVTQDRRGTKYIDRSRVMGGILRAA